MSLRKRPLFVAVIVIQGFCSAPLRAADSPAARLVPLQAHDFPLSAIRLLDGPFKRSQDAHAKYLLSLEPDRLLARFRSEAGLPAKAKSYPGWEDVELPGVGAGFYLSGCSRLWAVTGDKRFLDRLRYMLDELDACQKANGNGYLLATTAGKRIFAEVEKGDIRFADGWKLNGEAEPYYAMEKLFAGLRDAWRVAGLRPGLDLAIRLADWLAGHMAHLNDEQMQRLMECEFGGMNWVLADLYADTGKPQYLALSKRWHHKVVLDPLSRGVDALPGLHANTQFPKISGLAARYAYSGDPLDRKTAEFFWDRVVHHHSYVTGNNSLDEHFGPPDKLNDRLGLNNTENCNAWNMIRLTGLLFCLEPKAEYGDFVERLLWNQVLAAQHPGDGRVCYYLPLASDHTKPYETLYDRFSCCTCSGFDSYARHGDSIYFHSADTLFVNLFVASEVHWKDKKVTVRQETRFPEEGSVHFKLICDAQPEFKLALRRPHWATAGMQVTVNGVDRPISEPPGTYVVVERRWKTGDQLDIKMSLPVRIEAMPDNPRRVAFFKGPVLLAGDLGAADGPDNDVPVLIGNDPPLIDRLKPADGSPLRFHLTGVDPSRGVPMGPFANMHDRRYAVYFDQLTAEQATAHKAEREARQARQKALDARTVDKVSIGIAASERAHALKVEKSNTGSGAYGRHMDRRWRDAPDGWFSFHLKVARDQPQSLLCTYWGREVGSRTFDILVEGQTVATVSLTSEHDEAFYDVEYPIPANLVHGKTAVTVKFQSHPGNVAGGLFGLRVVKDK